MSRMMGLPPTTRGRAVKRQCPANSARPHRQQRLSSGNPGYSAQWSPSWFAIPRLVSRTLCGEEERQWVLGPRIDRGRRAASRPADRVLPATSDVEQPTVAKYRKAIVLASVAGTAGEQVVLPGKDILGVEVLGFDVLDLVAGRVLAVTAPRCAGTHGRESFSNDPEHAVLLPVVVGKQRLAGCYPFRVGTRSVHFRLIPSQAIRRFAVEAGIVQIQHPPVSRPLRPCCWTWLPSSSTRLGSHYRDQLCGRTGAVAFGLLGMAARRYSNSFCSLSERRFLRRLRFRRASRLRFCFDCSDRVTSSPKSSVA